MQSQASRIYTNVHMQSFFVAVTFLPTILIGQARWAFKIRIRKRIDGLSRGKHVENRNIVRSTCRYHHGKKSRSRLPTADDSTL